MYLCKVRIGGYSVFFRFAFTQQYLDKFKEWKKQDIEMFVVGELVVNHID